MRACESANTFSPHHLPAFGEQAEHRVVPLGEVQLEPAPRGKARAARPARVAVVRGVVRLEGGQRGERVRAAVHAAAESVDSVVANTRARCNERWKDTGRRQTTHRASAASVKHREQQRLVNKSLEVQRSY
jgi:hypothetical protein